MKNPHRPALLLALLLAAYVGALLWMRSVIAGKPLPRFLAVSDQFAKSEDRVAPTREVPR